MKKLILVFALIATVMSCSKDDDAATPTAEENTLIGRWHLIGFEDTVMYQFTETKRHTIYSTDGNFGGLETAIPEANDWSMENETLRIDLNFGNELIATPRFKCNGNVVDFIAEDGTIGTTLFREFYDITQCSE